MSFDAYYSVKSSVYLWLYMAFSACIIDSWTQMPGYKKSHQQVAKFLAKKSDGLLTKTVYIASGQVAEVFNAVRSIYFFYFYACQSFTGGVISVELHFQSNSHDNNWLYS